MQAGPLLSSNISPSFNSYSSSGTRNLAEIAARVVNEFRQENKNASSSPNDDVFGFEDDPCWGFAKDDHHHQSRSLITRDHHDHEKTEEKNKEEEEEEEEESEFEFAFVVSTEPESSPISADEIFHNGQIKPVYPLFDQSLLLDDTPKNDVVDVKKENEKTTRRTRQPLRQLMVEEERETTTSSSSFSSSEADDLEGLKQGTYCVWKPKSDAGKGRKKSVSNSTGSSKRWKFRDILSRSNSVGKERFLFVNKVGTCSKRIGKVEAFTEKEKNDVILEANDEVDEKVRNKDEDKKKSFLPYKQDFVGFLANVNGLSRNLHPF